MWLVPGLACDNISSRSSCMLQFLIDQMESITSHRRRICTTQLLIDQMECIHHPCCSTHDVRAAIGISEVSTFRTRSLEVVVH
jgi:hypothetical protein